MNLNQQFLPHQPGASSNVQPLEPLA